MNSKEKIKDILDWAQSWVNIDWRDMVILRQDLEELVKIAKTEQEEEDARVCDECDYRIKVLGGTVI